MAIQRYEPTVSIEHGRIASATGLRAVAENWAEVGRTGAKVADIASSEMEKQARLAGQKEGQQAVWVDPETGTPKVVGTLPDGTRPYAEEYRKAAEADYQSKLGVSALVKAGELANANVGNPEGFRNAWSGYIKGTVDSVPDDLKPGVETLLMREGARHYYTMQQEDFQRTQGQAKVSAMNLADMQEKTTVDMLRNAGLAGGTPEFLAQQRATLEGLMNDQVHYGIISPEEASQRLKDYDFRTERGMIAGEAIKMAKAGQADKVQGFLNEYVRSSNKNVDDYQRNMISDYARGEVATELAKAKAESSAAQEAAKKQVNDAADVWWKGENYALDDAQVIRIADATGDARLAEEARSALAARTAIKDFSLMSGPEQEAALSQSRKGGGETPDTLKLRDKLDSIYKETQSALDTGDTLALATRRGLVTADPIDPANPDTLKKRAEDVAKVDLQMGGVSNPLLPVEKDQLIKLFDGMDSEGKVQLYGSLKAGMGDDLASRALRQIGQKRPAMALAMGISDDAPEVSRSILMGDLALEADKQLLAGDLTNFADTFSSKVGTAVQGDDTLRNAIYEGAKAVYAESKKRGKELSFEDAIDQVTGGVAEYNGTKTIVPKRGMDSDGFEDLIDGMDDAKFRSAAGGKLLALNGKEVSADLIHSRGVFEWVGDGHYILKLKINDSLSGQTVFVADEKGNIIKDKWGRPVPAELNLKPLVGG